MKSFHPKLQKTPTTIAALILALNINTHTRAENSNDSLHGDWKFILMNTFDEDIFIFNISHGNKEPLATLKKSTTRGYRTIKINKIQTSNKKLLLDINFFGSQACFSEATEVNGKLFGVLRIHDQLFPARIEKTNYHVLNPPGESELEKSYQTALSDTNPNERIKKLTAILNKNDDDKLNQTILSSIFYISIKENLPECSTRAYAERWINSAGTFGVDWKNSILAKTIRLLHNKNNYANLSLDLTTQRRELLGENADLETRAEIEMARANAARLARRVNIAMVAETESNRLEKELDEHYRKNMPPFNPSAPTTRKNRTLTVSYC